MNRLQKKCFIGVALLHALPLLIAVVGTAFFNKKEKVLDSPRIIELVNFTVTDGPTRGGSAASMAPAPEPIPVPAARPVEPVYQKPAPEPEPPKPVAEIPKVQPVEKEVVAELPVPKKVVKTETKPVPAPKKTVKTPTKPAPIKRNIDISKPVTINPKEKQDSAAAAKAAEQRAREARASAVSGSLSRLGKGLSGSTTIELSGGSGGAAEINYGDLVLKKYDDAWVAPTEVDDDEAVVKARVVIARNGNVISAEISRGSGNSALDGSVRRTLKALRFIHPFPAGSTDSQRTYIINFNLKSKRGIG